MASGVTPPPLPGRNDNFSFLVYGDLRKTNRTIPLPEPACGSTAAGIVHLFRANEKNRPISLHILTADLTLDGSDLYQWAEFFQFLTFMNPNPANLQRHQISFFTTAVGNHDILSWMGVGPHGINYQWIFNPTIPNFGHFFFFDNLFPPGLAPVIGYKQHIQSTHDWFDYGRIRFVHLPVATEEIGAHYGEPIEKPNLIEENVLAEGLFNTTLKYIRDIGGALTKWIGTAFRKLTGPGYCTDFSDNVKNPFLNNLRNAKVAKERGDIDFIIVYGHTPLITSPQFNVPHIGILNSSLKPARSGEEQTRNQFAQQVINIMIESGVDAYLCGHNHIYDRCTLTTSNGDQIPMITMGIGTKLVHLKPSSLGHQLPIGNLTIQSEKVFYGAHADRELPGYIRCETTQENGNPIINCILIGKGMPRNPTFRGGLWPEETLGNNYDTFVIRKRKTIQEEPRVRIFAPIQIQEYESQSSP